MGDVGESRPAEEGDVETAADVEADVLAEAADAHALPGAHEHTPLPVPAVFSSTGFTSTRALAFRSLLFFVFPLQPPTFSTQSLRNSHTTSGAMNDGDPACLDKPSSFVNRIGSVVSSIMLLKLTFLYGSSWSRDSVSCLAKAFSESVVFRLASVVTRPLPLPTPRQRPLSRVRSRSLPTLSSGSSNIFPLYTLPLTSTLILSAVFELSCCFHWTWVRMLSRKFRKRSAAEWCETPKSDILTFLRSSVQSKLAGLMSRWIIP